MVAGSAAAGAGHGSRRFRLAVRIRIVRVHAGEAYGRHARVCWAAAAHTIRRSALGALSSSQCGCCLACAGSLRRN